MTCAIDKHAHSGAFMRADRRHMLQDVNLEDGTLCGSSTWHLPNGKSPVETAWEGEIIDNVNHTFLTQKWGATQQSDLKHWSKFAHFVPLRLNVLQRRGRWGGKSQTTLYSVI